MNEYWQYQVVTEVVYVGAYGGVVAPSALNELMRDEWEVESHHVFCDGGRIIHTWTVKRWVAEAVADVMPATAAEEEAEEEEEEEEAVEEADEVAETVEPAVMRVIEGLPLARHILQHGAEDALAVMNAQVAAAMRRGYEEAKARALPVLPALGGLERAS